MSTQGCSRQAIHGLLAHGPHPCAPPYGSSVDRQSGKAAKQNNLGNGNAPAWRVSELRRRVTWIAAGLG
jgi:hypothetical protein